MSQSDNLLKILMKKPKKKPETKRLFRVRLYSIENGWTYQTFHSLAENELLAISHCVEQLIETGQHFSSIHSVNMYQ